MRVTGATTGPRAHLPNVIHIQAKIETHTGDDERQTEIRYDCFQVICYILISVICRPPTLFTSAGPYYAYPRWDQIPIRVIY